jgi:hypothetical protein
MYRSIHVRCPAGEAPRGGLYLKLGRHVEKKFPCIPVNVTWLWTGQKSKRGSKLNDAFPLHRIAFAGIRIGVYSGQAIFGD